MGVRGIVPAFALNHRYGQFGTLLVDRGFNLPPAHHPSLALRASHGWQATRTFHRVAFSLQRERHARVSTSL